MNDLKLVDRTNKGITGKELVKFNDEFKILNKDWAFILGISPSTVSSYLRNNKTFNPLRSEKIFLILNLYKKGAETFGDLNKFNEWLTLENILLNNKAPKLLLNTYSGIKFLEEVLHRMYHGIFA